MFQNFDGPRHGKGDPKRLAGLRKALADAHLDGMIVPHADEHQSEYLPPSAERLAWLTGFSGSAGMAIVLASEAAVFVDGRYTLQVRNEIDVSAFESVPIAETTPADWLKLRLKPGNRIGVDATLATMAEAKRFGDICRDAGAELVLLDESPLDIVWRDRPAAPVGAVSLHPDERAGEASKEKLGRLAKIIADKKADALVLSAADSIAWIFNIRGSDIARNPLPLSYAIIRKDARPTLYLDGRKLSNSIRHALEESADIAEPSTLSVGLFALGADNAHVLLDPNGASASLDHALRKAGATIVESADPTQLLKARKNAAELDGMRAAHLRDGIAMVRFLAWLDRETPSGNIDEIAAAEALERFRSETAAAEGVELADLSFDTISGAGPNGAIVHYRVNRETNRKLEIGSLYLVDSGGQYRDGTTDITRTVAIGTPTAEMRRAFTLVLKGNMALSDARFPKGTNGAQLDTLARQFLWKAGLDYDHGTGHGVGAYLSVHEGPARISKTGTIALEPGMILSNEPGYYKTGEFGIRIENLLLVTDPAPIDGGERPMLGFEVLTFAPIDLRLVDASLLTASERIWLNGYHARIRVLLAARLSKEDSDWLMAATKPLA